MKKLLYYTAVAGLMVVVWVPYTILALNYDYPRTNEALGSIQEGIADKIDAIYKDCLGRYPLTSEKAAYIQKVIGGSSYDSIKGELCNSQAGVKYREDTIASTQTRYVELKKEEDEALNRSVNLEAKIVHDTADSIGIKEGTVAGDAIDIAKEALVVKGEVINLVGTFYGGAAGKIISGGVEDAINLIGHWDQENLHDFVQNGIKRAKEVVKDFGTSIVNIGKAISCGVKKVFGGSCDKKMSQADAETAARQLFRQELGRDPDAGGLKEFAKLIRNEGMDKAIAAVRNSPEGQSLKRISCGSIGASRGYQQSQLQCQAKKCPSGYSDIGKSSDCNFCCASTKSAPASTKSSASSPATIKAACGSVGASQGYQQSQLQCQAKKCPSGYSNLGKTSDCNLCCATKKK